MGVQLRLAESHDVEAITTLINTAFLQAESFLIDRDRITAGAVRDLLQKGKFLLAEDKGTLAACVYVELGAERAYVGLLSVDPRRQKAGLGSRLMSAAEAYCANAGCRFMDLQIINLRQELPAFYHRLGYVETGIAP
jgi:N-acetylglutamate synthase-like GNAT family acetyltransferase